MQSTIRLTVLSFLALALIQAQSMHAQSTAGSLPQPVSLWANGAPGALGTSEADKPRLYPFIPQTRSTKAAVLIIPGGGYQIVALGHEGIQIARWLNAQGIAAFVLDYRVAPYKYPVEIDDGMRAMRYVKAHAAQYGIDANSVGVWGFSAGGHLASTIGTHCGAGNADDPDPINRLNCRPGFMILAYPVIGMQAPVTHQGSRDSLLGPNPDPALVQMLSNQFAVNAETPPTFLFATTGDPAVPVENSLDFYRALERAHIPAEIHIFDYSDHGCGLCGTIPTLAQWPLLLRNWLILRKVIPQNAPPMPPAEPNMPVWPQGITGPGEVH